jgi:uncharacterized protein YjiS (DUF1127 family)
MSVQECTDFCFDRQPARRISPIAFVRAAIGVARQRQHLGALDDRLLRDIGIDRLSVEEETKKPVWDVPVHWLK